MVTEQSSLRLVSLAALIVAYTLISSWAQKPDLLPPASSMAEAFAGLLTAGIAQKPAGEEHAHAGHHMHSSEQVETLLQEGVTLQGSLAVSTARVLFGLVVGLPLGILIGLLLGWSRRADDYLHPIYVLFRSIPPLALIPYVMLCLRHRPPHPPTPLLYPAPPTTFL